MARLPSQQGQRDFLTAAEPCAPRYDTDSAQRHYQAVEPENRLVARELGRRWETVLRELQDLEQQYARFRQSATAK